MGASIDFSQSSEKILQESEIFVDKNALSLDEIKQNVVFQPSSSSHINLGFTSAYTVWVRFTFTNSDTKNLRKILEIHNPLLSGTILYQSDSLREKILKPYGLHTNINRAYLLHLNAGETKSYYLKVQNKTTALRFGISLQDELAFIYEDHKQQLIIFIFISILGLLFIYNLVLFAYTKERAYAYYSLYLLTLVFQQATYLGVMQMFFPEWFVYYDDLAVVFKVNAMFLAAALFAKSFLLAKNYPKINKIYNIIIFVAIIEMPLFGFPTFYYPEIAILTGFFFVLFNVYAGFYIYRQGYKQARLFVLGWSFLALGFGLMILDGLGLISVMHEILNIILFLTAFEAIVLSLAFTDRYMILKEQKERSEQFLLQALHERQKVIGVEIEKHTRDLNEALENSKILLKELHHRTKNNLQLILSLIRMQAKQGDENIKNYSKNLESRINAITRAHQMLYLKSDLTKINMQEYLFELCNDLKNLSEKNIQINCNAKDINIPLHEAAYVGLIVNEVITNSIKYVEKEPIEISLKMQKEGELHKIQIKDNGDGLGDTIKKAFL